LRRDFAEVMSTSMLILKRPKLRSSSRLMDLRASESSKPRERQNRRRMLRTRLNLRLPQALVGRRLMKIKKMPRMKSQRRKSKVLRLTILKLQLNYKQMAKNDSSKTSKKTAKSYPTSAQTKDVPQESRKACGKKSSKPN